MSCVTTSEFSDFESFREQLQGWDTRPVQLGRGELRIRRDELHLPNLSLANLGFDLHIADSSAQEEDTVNFVVTARPHLWCGREVPPGSLVILAPGRDHRCAMRHGFRSFEMAVSEGLLQELGLISDLVHPRNFAPERCVLSLAPSQRAAFASIAKDLGSCSGKELTAAQAEHFRSRSLAALMTALQSATLPGLRQVPFYGLACRALRMVEKDRAARLSVKTIARTLGVTPRALEYAFKSATGVSTLRFLLSRRLNQVRSELVAPERPTVSASASRHGFRHMGRFSGQYMQLFAKLPSQTRRATPLPAQA